MSRVERFGDVVGEIPPFVNSSETIEIRLVNKLFSVDPLNSWLHYLTHSMKHILVGSN